MIVTFQTQHITTMLGATFCVFSHPIAMRCNLLGVANQYSCFEKGCLSNGEKLTQQFWKLWVMVIFTVAWLNLKVFQSAERKQHKQAYSFFLFPCCWINLPQSCKTTLLLPIMYIDIVVHAFTLLRDNLYRNSCLQHAWVDELKTS